LFAAMQARRRVQPIVRHASTSKVDTHPADIVAALRKNGWSLRKLSEHYNMHPQTIGTALRKDYPKAEKLIALALGVKPETIWPSRYAQRAARRGRRKSA
jgi:Ner family transcriptional regulator